ncbi:hypothetical protein P4E94_07100 [Pontiellaceae bacterium B12219]|nr:hypothetical protein [Pontiellaceae bacterium B12219]
MLSNPKKKQFFQKHAKSSAALVSLGIHALLIVVALSFVAVTVIKKEEQSFEAKPVNRPKMQLRKLQVPVNIKKKQVQKPKLRKRIVVQPKINQTTPDIKMPEITGVKGGLGNAGGDGLGGAGTLGFSMPEIEVFGVKSKGEKVFIILDSSPWMMYDEMGGIPAYKVIKEELVTILGNLNPTVLFNIAVFDKNQVITRFPDLVSASSSNVEKVKEWLETLNATADQSYGLRTLGKGGARVDGDQAKYAITPLQRTSDWSTAAMVAMQQQADTVFVLTQSWGWQFHEAKAAKEWSQSKRDDYERKKKEAHQKLEEDNKKRVAEGLPPQVLVGHSLINKYFPNTEHPPQPQRYHYSPKEMYAGLTAQRKANKPESMMTSGLGRRSSKKEMYSVNVIMFTPEDYDTSSDPKKQENFVQLTRIADGSFKTLAGLAAIQDSATGGSN